MIGTGRSIDRSLYRVGQVWNDWSPFALFVVLVAAVFGLGAATWTTVARYTAHDRHVFGVYVLSEFLLLLPFASDKTKKIRDLDGEVLVWTIDAIARHGYILDPRDRMLGDALGAALWGGGIGAGLLIGAVVVLRIVHWRNSMQRRRGAGEKRAAMASRRWTGLALDSILRPLPACVRFVRKSITLRVFSGSTERGDQHLSSAGHDREAEPGVTAEAQRAAAWAVAHLSEREAVFARTDLLTAALAWNPGKVSIEEAEAAVGRMEKEGTLHAARTPVLGDALTTDKALVDETETIALMERAQGRSKPVMRKWIASPLLHNGRLPSRDAGDRAMSDGHRRWRRVRGVRLDRSVPPDRGVPPCWR